MNKPEMKYEDGKLVVDASAQVDADKDGKPSVSASVKIEIDAMEAVSEIIKKEVPEWLKGLLAGKL
jgi:hypothetical protein